MLWTASAFFFWTPRPEAAISTVVGHSLPRLRLFPAGMLVLCACTPAPPELEVWYDGCFGLDRGVCLPGPAPHRDRRPPTLRVWVAGVAPEALAVEGAEVVQRHAIDGGAWAELRVVEGAEALVMTGAGGSRPWVLPLRRWPDPLVQAGGLPVAEAVAAVDRSLPELSEADRGLALRVSAMWSMEEGFEDATALVDRLARALALQEGAGSTRDAELTSLMKAYLEEHQLAAIGPGAHAASTTGAQVDVLHRAATLWASLRAARWTGRFSDALAHVDQLKLLDRRVLGGDYLPYYASQEGELLELLGDHEGSVALHAAQVPEDKTCSAWALPARNHALALERARERGVEVAGSRTIRESLEGALACAQAGGGSDGELADQADLLVDLARVVLHEGDDAAAAVHLSAFDALEQRSPSAVRHGTWLDRHLVAARLAQRRGELEAALVEAERGLARVDAWEWPMIQLSLHLLRAGLLEEVGRRDEATAAYRDLHEGWVSQGPLVPIQRGRAGFLSVAARALPSYVDLLVQDGRAREAVDLLREARFQLLAGLQAVPALHTGDTGSGGDTGSWEGLRAEVAELVERREARQRRLFVEPLDLRPAVRAELEWIDRQIREAIDEALLPVAPQYVGERRGPLPGELMLTWADQGARRQLFALTTRGLVVREGARGDPALLSAVVAEALASTAPPTRVTVLPAPADEGAPVHLVALDGQPLLTQVPVVWSLDLPAREGPEEHGRRALVVGDPRRDLRDAREEATLVAARLVEAGWSVTLLVGREATREALLAELPEVDLLHYAGHGAFSGSRRASWDARLLLAEEGELGVVDVLLLPAVPAWVVLSGCDTARSTDLDVTDLGLAQAFLTRGSEAVLGTTDEVDSGVARGLALSFHADLARRGDPVLAFQHALVSSKELLGTPAAGAFRLLVP